MNRLLVIGGPTCSGKSFLIDRLREGRCPRLGAQLDYNEQDAWLYIQGRELAGADLSNADRVLLHYDFRAQYRDGPGFMHLRELVGSCPHVTMVTLCTPVPTMIHRMTRRILKRGLVVLVGRAPYAPLRELCLVRKTFSDGRTVADLYEKWFAVLSELIIAEHWLVDQRGPPESLALSPALPLGAEATFEYNE